MGLQQNLAVNLRAVKELRKKDLPCNSENMTLLEFSEALGVSKNTVKDILSERANTTLATIEQMAAHLDEPAISLLSSGLVESELNITVKLLQSLEAFSLLEQGRQEQVRTAFHEAVEAIDRLFDLLGTSPNSE